MTTSKCEKCSLQEVFVLLGGPENQDAWLRFSVFQWYARDPGILESSWSACQACTRAMRYSSSILRVDNGHTHLYISVELDNDQLHKPISVARSVPHARTIARSSARGAHFTFREWAFPSVSLPPLFYYGERGPRAPPLSIFLSTVSLAVYGIITTSTSLPLQHCYITVASPIC